MVIMNSRVKVASGTAASRGSLSGCAFRCVGLIPRSSLYSIERDEERATALGGHQCSIHRKESCLASATQNCTALACDPAGLP